MAPRRRSRRSLASGIAVALVALLWSQLDPEGWARIASVGSSSGSPEASSAAEALPAPRSGPSLSRLFEERRSGTVVESEGRVVAVLRDDREGSRHQRFILETEPGFTILVSHNIDLAPRVAGLARGDAVAFRGQYEWNEKGGVVHWTHHDPGRRRPGGWLRHEGRTYR